MREAALLKVANTWTHPNIVQYIGYEQKVLALEYCPGGCLEGHIHPNGLQPSECQAFFTQFSNGLQQWWNL